MRVFDDRREGDRRSQREVGGRTRGGLADSVFVVTIGAAGLARTEGIVEALVWQRQHPREPACCFSTAGSSPTRVLARKPPRQPPVFQIYQHHFACSFSRMPHAGDKASSVSLVQISLNSTSHNTYSLQLGNP